MNVEAVPGDTRPEAAWVQLGIWRRMAPSKRLQLALQMSDSLRKVVAAGVRSRDPDYSVEQETLAVIRLTVGDELFRKAYPGVEVEV